MSADHHTAAEHREEVRRRFRDQTLTLPLLNTLEEVGAAHVAAVVELCGNKTVAAEVLGISRRGLYYMLRRRTQ